MSNAIPPYSTLSPQVKEVYNRLTYLHNVCEECSSCDHCEVGYDACPYQQEAGPWDNYHAPCDTSREDRIEIARRLLHDE